MTMFRSYSNFTYEDPSLGSYQLSISISGMLLMFQASVKMGASMSAVVVGSASNSLGAISSCSFVLLQLWFQQLMVVVCWFAMTVDNWQYYHWLGRCIWGILSIKQVVVVLWRESDRCLIGEMFVNCSVIFLIYYFAQISLFRRCFCISDDVFFKFSAVFPFLIFLICCILSL